MYYWQSPLTRCSSLTAACYRSLKFGMHMTAKIYNYSSPYLSRSRLPRRFQKVVPAPVWGPRPNAPALSNIRSPSPQSISLNSVPYGAALRILMSLIPMMCYVVLLSGLGGVIPPLYVGRVQEANSEIHFDVRNLQMLWVSTRMNCEDER